MNRRGVVFAIQNLGLNIVEKVILTSLIIHPLERVSVPEMRGWRQLHTGQVLWHGSDVFLIIVVLPSVLWTSISPWVTLNSQNNTDVDAQYHGFRALSTIHVQIGTLSRLGWLWCDTLLVLDLLAAPLKKSRAWWAQAVLYLFTMDTFTMWRPTSRQSLVAAMPFRKRYPFNYRYYGCHHLLTRTVLDILGADPNLNLNLSVLNLL